MGGGMPLKYARESVYFITGLIVGSIPQYILGFGCHQHYMYHK